MIERTLCQLLPGPSLAANPVELLRVFTSFTLFNDLDGWRLDLSRLSDFRFCKDIATWGPGASLQSDFTCKKIPSLEYNGSRYYTKSSVSCSARLSNRFCQVRDLFCLDAMTSHASVHGDVTMALCRVTRCNGREGGKERGEVGKELSKLPSVMLSHWNSLRRCPCLYFSAQNTDQKLVILFCKSLLQNDHVISNQFSADALRFAIASPVLAICLQTSFWTKKL